MTHVLVLSETANNNGLVFNDWINDCLGTYNKPQYNIAMKELNNRGINPSAGDLLFFPNAAEGFRAISVA